MFVKLGRNLTALHDTSRHGPARYQSSSPGHLHHAMDLTTHCWRRRCSGRWAACPPIRCWPSAHAERHPIGSCRLQALPSRWTGRSRTCHPLLISTSAWIVLCSIASSRSRRRAASLYSPLPTDWNTPTYLRALGFQTVNTDPKYPKNVYLTLWTKSLLPTGWNMATCLRVIGFQTVNTVSKLNKHLPECFSSIGMRFLCRKSPKCARHQYQCFWFQT